MNINKVLNFFELVGKKTFNFIYLLGQSTEKLILIIIKIFMPPYYFKNFINQCLEIGFYSLPVIALTSLFSGMVLALQSYNSINGIPSNSLVANIVAVSLTRELAPVLTSLMVTGRIASSISAEIGTMKVTEQLDALFILSVNPIKFLVAPRVIAGLLCLPILVFLSDILGIFGGYLIAVLKINLNGFSYIRDSYNAITFYGVTSGLIKGLVFGFILTSIGCFFGFNSKNGASGVGKSTTYAVVFSSILIFILDYILTMLFFGVK